MRTQQISLALPPVGAVLLWVALAAAGLPALATMAGVVVLLAAYGRLALSLVSAQQRNEQLTDAARAGDAAGRARRLAIIDPSNDLLARWYFELRVEGEALRCLRYEEQVALVVLHHSQARPLSALAAQEAAGMALRGVRETDLVGSLEDGFGLCLIHCDRAHAEQVASRLVSRLGLGWQAGIAVIPEDEQSGKPALLLARERLEAANRLAA